MSSFPSAVSAIANYRPAENIDPQEIQKNALAARLAQGQIAMQPGVQEAQELANQQAKLDLQSQQAMMRAFTEGNGDPDKTVKLAAQYGAKPQDIIGLRTHFIQQAQQLNALSTEQQNLLQKHSQLVQSAAERILAAKPEDRAQVYAQERAQALASGEFKPEEWPEQYQGEQFVRVHAAAANTVQKQLNDLQKQNADTAKSQADAAKAQADAQKSQIEADFMKQYGGMTPGMQESRYIAIQQKPPQMRSPEENAFSKAYEKTKTMVPTATFNLQNGATQQNLDTAAQSIAGGQMKWQDFVSPRTPMAIKTALLQAVKQINPQFNSGDFEVEKKVRELFTSGDVSKQLMAISTAREHMKTFSQLADALNNGDTQLANRIGNTFGVQFGSDKATNFKIASQAFGGEVGKAFDGAGVTQSERESASKSFNENMSPGQFKGAVRTVDELLAGKQRAAQQSYNAGTSGKPNFGGQQHAPGAQANLPEGATGTGSDGKKYVVKGGVWVLQQSR